MKESIKTIDKSGRSGSLALYNFLQAVIEAHKEGYELSTDPSVKSMPRRVTAGRYFCQMVKQEQAEIEEDEEITTKEENIQQEESVPEDQTDIDLRQLIESTDEYKDLKAIAEKYNLDKGEKLYNPKALKNHLLMQL